MYPQLILGVPDSIECLRRTCRHADALDEVGCDRCALASTWLARSAVGDVFSRYHAEAAIAAEHCFAPSFAETRWHEIADLYAMLERIAVSLLHTLNRAGDRRVARGDAGLALLQDLVPPAWLAGSYLWDAVLADLHRRARHAETARRHAASGH